MFRLGERELNHEYDEENDVLYLWLGSEPGDTITEEAGDGILVDFDPATHEVVGVTLLDYKKRWADKTEITFSAAPPSVTASLVLS